MVFSSHGVRLGGRAIFTETHEMKRLRLFPKFRVTKRDHLKDVRFHLERGDYYRAIGECEAALAENPLNFEPLWTAANIYANNLKDYDKAASLLEELIANEEKVDQKHWSMAAFRAADIYAHNLNNKERARQLLSRIAERFPNSEESGLAQNRLENLDTGKSSEQK